VNRPGEKPPIGLPGGITQGSVRDVYLALYSYIVAGSRRGFAGLDFTLFLEPARVTSGLACRFKETGLGKEVVRRELGLQRQQL
jgi:hypothetical protein